jgi:protoporphyrin/coproporphyrin ferrochelatase
MARISVVLFNLGGPDSVKSIRPFLTNFFDDPAIISAPSPVRFILSRYIAWKRGRVGGPAGISYGMMGGKSPLLENSQKQAVALQDFLNQTQDRHEYTVHIVMRYWHPRAHEIAQIVKSQDPDQIVLLPLYPQYSTTTTGSSIKEWQDISQKIGLATLTKTICCYPTMSGFIQASVDQIKTAYQDFCAAHPNIISPRILLSAHGLPTKIIKAGDPYQSQCEQTAHAIARELSAVLNIKNLDWEICYQSRVGPLSWIKPSTEEALEKAAKDQVPVIIYPHAFVSEHVETLVEIEHEYRELAHQLGVPGFIRAGTVMTHPSFIKGLGELVQGSLSNIEDLAPGVPNCHCDFQWVKCPCIQKQGTK